nr:midnolin [Nomia melanderi]
MDGSSGPPSDVTMAMGTENDEGSKVRRDGNDSGNPSGTATATYSTSQPEYCGQGLIRAGSASPTLPTTSSPSSSSLSSSSSSSSSSTSSASSCSSSSLSSSPQQPGCGCAAATVLEPDEITISITPTTGGQFDLTVDRTDTIENLKKIISKRLKVAKERICLLHRERLLCEGTLEENRLQDGSRLTLLPNVETGLLAQRPEQSVMQALESLNDSQVNDFLSGKAPLNLTMRLGDHMMLIQLQLSTVTPASPTSNQTTGNSTGLTIGSSNGTNPPSSHVSTSLQSRRSTVFAGRTTNAGSTKSAAAVAARRSSLFDRLASTVQRVFSRSTSLSTATTTTSPVCSSRATTASSVSSSSSSYSGHGCPDTIPYEVTPPRKKLCTVHHHSQQSTNPIANSSSRSSASADAGDSNSQSPTSSMLEQNSKAATLDTRALAEASRNLTQKLKQLSSEENARRRQGAIIESMHHHGKGVYSGTFSGTLNPALQDRHGRPKRAISTIIHILNDLLCATPAATTGHYRHHHRHSNGRQLSSAFPSSAGTTTTVNGSSTPTGCHETSTSEYPTEELSKENEATKGKMRRLRLVMEQRRAKRKARRQARAAPYTTQWAAVTPDPDPNHDPKTSSAATANPTEPQNEPELQPCSPEPVVA